jgi:hypothetical protein
VNALLNEHIEHVSNRVKELRVIEKNLSGLRSLCQQARAAKDCGIFFSRWEVPQRALYDRRMLSTGTVAGSRRIQTVAIAVTTWTTFTPCFLWIFLGGPYIAKLRGNESLTKALCAVPER